MTLGFSTQFPDGTPTMFEEKIRFPFDTRMCALYPDMKPKIHTFRFGNRWKSGMRMHMVYGNRTPSRRQFNQDIPDLEYCNGVQQCTIKCITPPSVLFDTILPAPQYFSIQVDGRDVDDLLFIPNDGFETPQQFFDWFGHPFRTTEHVGQIIHFTEFRY